MYFDRTRSELIEVAPGLYRGGHPEAQKFQQIKGLGIKQVLRLNAEELDVVQEYSEAAGGELLLHHVPVNPWIIPPEDTVCRILRILSTHTGKSLYVHCWFGRDRTGLVISLYRTVFQGWSVENALAEMRGHGFAEELSHFPEALRHYTSHVRKVIGCGNPFEHFACRGLKCCDSAVSNHLGDQGT